MEKSQTDQKVQPYLFFDGKCEEALEFYKSALGAKVDMMLRFKDNPEPQQSGPGCAAGSEDKIMHAAFHVGNTLVMASDGMAGGKPEFKGFSLSVSAANEAEADRMFAALGKGGQVQMPMGKTFFSPRFGMVADKFGVGWMVLVPGKDVAVQKISNCLWFDGQAEEAAKFYVSVFRNSKIKQTVLYGDTGPGPKGSVMTVHFELDGREFLGLNAGPMFKFNHAISMMVNCETQKELDEMWDKLSAGGATEQCGWLRDKYGLSWQIVPAILPQLLGNPATSDKVMQAVVKMTKLDIATMQKAAA